MTDNIREADKLEVYERTLRAIARQPDDIMYEGDETDPVFQGKSRQHWAATALAIAGAENVERRDPYKD